MTLLRSSRTAACDKPGDAVANLLLHGGGQHDRSLTHQPNTSTECMNVEGVERRTMKVDLSGRWFLQSVEQPQQRRFAGPARPDKCSGVAFVKVIGDMTQDLLTVADYTDIDKSKQLGGRGFVWHINAEARTER